MSQIVDRKSDSQETGQPIGDPPGEQFNGSPKRSASLEEIHAPIKRELAAVETILTNELSGDQRNETPWVDELLKHSRIVGGKRMRPVFLLLSGACCMENSRSGNGSAETRGSEGKSAIDDRHFNMAAALEMIHTATLIHDDVLDNAETRRHQPTANSRWGNKISVLLGDYLFTHAFHIASLAGSADAMRVLAESSNRVCAGEMRQNGLAGNFEMSEAQYLSVVSDKTAELCAGGCALGAMLSGADDATIRGFEDFGRDIGIAFQIIDDVLDLVGSPDQVGKTLGTDIANRKPTLPVIHALVELSGSARDELLGLLNAEEPLVERVVENLDSTRSIEYARTIANEHAGNAISFARTLEENDYSRALMATAKFVLAPSR